MNKRKQKNIGIFIDKLVKMFNNLVKKMKYFVFGLISILSLIVLLMLTSFVMRISNPVVDSSVDSDKRITNEEKIQINILNGCGVNGLASRTNEYLRTYKFDVLEVGNYPENIEKSIIIDRLGDMESAKKVAYAVGIPDSLIFTRIDSSLFIRTSIVLGNDYEKLAPFN